MKSNASSTQAAEDELACAFARRTELALTDLGFGLFLGAGRAAADAALLQRFGITHILNVADDVPRAAATEHLGYCCLGVGDFGADAGISRVFDAAFAFVQPVLEQASGCVLVHCANGSNRSPSVAIALLMLLFDWPLATAWEHVACRRTIQPLADNRRELLAFERRRGAASMAEGAGGTLVALEQQSDGEQRSDGGDLASTTASRPDPPSADGDGQGQVSAAGTSAAGNGDATPAAAPGTAACATCSVGKCDRWAAHRAARRVDPPRRPVASTRRPPRSPWEDTVDRVLGRRCDGPHETERCPHFSKPREQPPQRGEVRFD